MRAGVLPRDDLWRLTIPGCHQNEEIETDSAAGLSSAEWQCAVALRWVCRWLRGLLGDSGWGDGKVGPVPHSSSHIPQAPPWSFTKGVGLFKSVLNSMLPVRPVSRLQGCQWIPIKLSPASPHPRTLGFPWIEEKEVGNQLGHLTSGWTDCPWALSIWRHGSGVKGGPLGGCPEPWLLVFTSISGPRKPEEAGIHLDGASVASSGNRLLPSPMPAGQQIPPGPRPCWQRFLPPSSCPDQWTLCHFQITLTGCPWPWPW